MHFKATKYTENEAAVPTKNVDASDRVSMFKFTNRRLDLNNTLMHTCLDQIGGRKGQRQETKISGLPFDGYF